MIRIITEAKLRKMLKEAYEKGINIGDKVREQTRKMDESHMGTILDGYDLGKALDEILKRKAPY